MAKLRIARNKIEEKTDAGSWSRAASYVGKFEWRLRFKNRISGKVAGSSVGVEYEVSLDADSDGNLIGDCNCPSPYYFCKHIAALGLAYIEGPETFTDVSDVLKELQSKSKAELLELIERMVAAHPETLTVLGVEGFENEEDDWE